MLLFSGIHHHQPPRKPWLFERGLGLTRKITKIAKRRAAWIEGVCDAGMVVCAPPPPNLTPQPGSSRGAAGSTPPLQTGKGGPGSEPRPQLDGAQAGWWRRPHGALWLGSQLPGHLPWRQCGGRGLGANSTLSFQ